jgi:hypothetical protein
MPEILDEAIAVIDVGQAHSLAQDVVGWLCERLKGVQGGMVYDVVHKTSPGVFGVGNQPRMMGSFVLVWLRGPKELLLVGWDVVQKTAAHFQRRPSYFRSDSSEFAQFKRRHFEIPNPR